MLTNDMAYATMMYKFPSGSDPKGTPAQLQNDAFDIIIVDDDDITDALKDGWFLNPDEARNPVKTTKK